MSVLKQIVRRAPGYDYIYLGDNARAPYGGRSFETVYSYTLEAVKWLFSRGCLLIILACNTASAKALRNIQQRYLPRLNSQKRVLGVIRPVTELVGKLTKTGCIGLFATSGTVRSQSYAIEIKKFFPSIRLIEIACPLWVPLVENNEFENDGAAYFIKKYIGMLLERDPLIDAIILGCTHYSIMENQIRRHLPGNIKLINQGDIVARSLAAYLKRHPEIDEKLSKNGSITFFTTDFPGDFDRCASLFYDGKVVSRRIDL